MITRLPVDWMPFAGLRESGYGAAAFLYYRDMLIEKWRFFIRRHYKLYFNPTQNLNVSGKTAQPPTQLQFIVNRGLQLIVDASTWVDLLSSLNRVSDKYFFIRSLILM